MEILLKDGVTYSQHTWETENEFEKIVLGQFKSIFGENTILFGKQKIKTETGIGSIPDAFVICPDIKKWFIIEVELATHDVYRHIIPQITKFKNALTALTRKTLTKFFDGNITNDLHKMAAWNTATKNKDIYRELSEIIDEDPELLIIIDELNPELETASKNLPFKTQINIFKTFCRKGYGLGDNIFQFNDTIEKIAESKNKIIPKSFTEKKPELIHQKKFGKNERSDNDVLLDQIIPVIKSIKRDGKEYYTIACTEIANKLGIHRNTVADKCTRILGLTTDMFIDHVKKGTIIGILKNKYPNRNKIIEEEL